MKNILLNIFILLFTFNVVLLGNSVAETTSTNDTSVLLVNTTETVETVEVALDSFGTIGMILLIVFSSILGAFFVKDELSKALN